jgi:hypothetical protein
MVFSIKLMYHFLVSCDRHSMSLLRINHSDLGNHQGYFISNDTINLKIDSYECLRSHDVQFTIENDTFQEVVGCDERLGGNENDEVSCFILLLYILLS